MRYSRNLESKKKNLDPLNFLRSKYFVDLGLASVADTIDLSHHHRSQCMAAKFKCLYNTDNLSVGQSPKKKKKIFADDVNDVNGRFCTVVLSTHLVLSCLHYFCSIFFFRYLIEIALDRCADTTRMRLHDDMSVNITFNIKQFNSFHNTFVTTVDLSLFSFSATPASNARSHTQRGR